MSFRFYPNDCSLVFAKEFLRGQKLRGREFTAGESGLVFYALSDCLCLGDKHQAILPVLTSGALPFIFRESCPYLANERHLTGIAARSLEASKDVVELEQAVPLFPPGGGNLWHWTTESLPKAFALESIGYDGPYIVPTGSEVARQSLLLAGIGEERQLPCGPAYRVRQLLLPQRLSGFSLAENMPLSGFLRESLLSRTGRLAGGKRCYIRRIGARKIVNEQEVLAVLRDFSFECMTPEDLSLEDQWRFMTNVECSVMVHGANATLTLLQKPESGFVELFGNRYISYTSLHAVRLLGLRYHCIAAELDVGAAVSEAGDFSALRVDEYLRGGPTADIHVDPLHLRIILEGFPS